MELEQEGGAMKELRQDITPRRATTTLLVAIVVMLLVPVGADAADKLVSIFDAENGAVADVNPAGALEVGDDRGPLPVDGSVNVEPGSEPLMIDGAVEIDEESQPIAVEGASFPGIPPNRLQFEIFGQFFQYVKDVPYVAITSITASNDSEAPIRIDVRGVYDAEICTEEGNGFSLNVPAQSTIHMDLPAPIVFGRQRILCFGGEWDVKKQGVIVSSPSEDPRSVLVLGYHG
jgi:hypothetical protein